MIVTSRAITISAQIGNAVMIVSCAIALIVASATAAPRPAVHREQARRGGQHQDAERAMCAQPQAAKGDR
jgi:hypothetical protein